MTVFGRRRKKDEQGTGEQPRDAVEALPAQGSEGGGGGPDAQVGQDGPDGEARGTRAGAGRRGRPDRTDGPYDLTEVDDPAEGGRIDLGGVWLPAVSGMELRVETDQERQSVVSVAAVVGQGAVQVQAFAAPRSEGVWGDVRREIAEGVRGQGGRTGEREGPYGPELLAEVPVRLPDGQAAVQPVRFVGVDGPRWFLRGVFTGAAAVDPQQAAPLEELFRGIVVVRGAAAMAPRELIALRLPQQAEVAPGAAPGGGDSPDGPDSADGGDGPDSADGPGQRSQDDLKPFERGPEITEVR